MSDYVTKQLAILPPELFTESHRWLSGESLDGWIVSRALELSCVAHDLDPLARDLGFDGPPFRWDPDRRFIIRCELDAAFFHLYGIERDDVDYIMERFPIVKRKDERAYGSYRTKETILRYYDRMAEAMDGSAAFESELEPGPGDVGATISTNAQS